MGDGRGKAKGRQWPFQQPTSRDYRQQVIGRLASSRASADRMRLIPHSKVCPAAAYIPGSCLIGRCHPSLIDTAFALSSGLLALIYNH
jgi:hypothetical protein